MVNESFACMGQSHRNHIKLCAIFICSFHLLRRVEWRGGRWIYFRSHLTSFLHMKDDSSLMQCSYNRHHALAKLQQFGFNNNHS